MARSYSVRVVALILRLDGKWLDNLLSRFHLPGVSRSRQGVERGISEDGLLAIELCRILNLELGVSIARSVAIVDTGVHGGEGDMRFSTPSGLTLSMDLSGVRRRLRERTLDAVEAAPVTRRGRPPRSPSVPEPA